MNKTMRKGDRDIVADPKDMKKRKKDGNHKDKGEEADEKKGMDEDEDDATMENEEIIDDEEVDKERSEPLADGDVTVPPADRDQSEDEERR